MLNLFIITNQKTSIKTDVNAFLKVVTHLKNNFNSHLIEQLAERFGMKYNELQFLINNREHSKEYLEQSFEEGGFA